MQKLMIYLFTYQGRIKRWEWWFARVGAIFACAIITGIISELFRAEFLLYLCLPICMWFQLVFSIRRLHDTDLSGLCMFLFIIPLYAVIVCGCLRGTEGKNRFG